MDKIIIPIGFQCTLRYAMDEVGIDSPSLPFDWMFAPPKFVHNMLHLLLAESMDIEQLVNEKFFHTHTLAQWTGPGYLAAEEYREWHEGYPYNKLGSAVFPHDGDNKPHDEIRVKYTRRFKRLKEHLLNKEIRPVLVYISQSSVVRTHGNFFIDDIEILTDTYQHLNNIYNLIESVRGDTFDMVMIDAIQSNDKIELNNKIKHHAINSGNGWKQIVHPCAEIIKLYK